MSSAYLAVNSYRNSDGPGDLSPVAGNHNCPVSTAEPTSDPTGTSTAQPTGLVLTTYIYDTGPLQKFTAKGYVADITLIGAGRGGGHCAPTSNTAHRPGGHGAMVSCNISTVPGDMY
jgi:hypothetical protein